MWLVVVGGLAAGQLGLLVTSSSLPWPGLAWPGRLDTTDPSRDNFHQKSSAADHLTTAAREQRGGRNLIRSFMSSGRILQLSLWFLSSILADSVFSVFIELRTSDIYTQEYSMGSFVIT